MPEIVAVPSFVVPGTVAENVAFLRHRVREVGLCFFETQACLAYTDADLPQKQDAGDLCFHVHLPLDLSWPEPSAPEEGALHTADVAFAVFTKAARLKPHCAVLHPPDGHIARQRALLAVFVKQWRTLTSVPLLLENTPQCSVASLGSAFLRELPCGFCLDTGHLLAYNQRDILASDLPDRAMMLHWSAPGPRLPPRHWPLPALSCDQKKLLMDIVPRLPQKCTHMIELFSWESIVASLPVFRQLLCGNKA